MAWDEYKDSDVSEETVSDISYDDSSSDFDDTAEIEEDGALSDAAAEELTETEELAEDTADADALAEDDAEMNELSEDTADAAEPDEDTLAEADDLGEDTAGSDDLGAEDTAEADDFAEDTAESDETGEAGLAETDDFVEDVAEEEPELGESQDDVTAEEEPELGESEDDVTAEEEPEPGESQDDVTVEEEPELGESEDDVTVEEEPELGESAGDLQGETDIPKDTAPAAADYIPDYQAVPQQDAAHGFLKDSEFAEETGDGTVDPARLDSFTADTKLEDMTRAEYDALNDKDPACAHQILTDYNNRTAEPVDVTQCSRNIRLDDGSFYTVTDVELSPDHSSLYNAETGDTYQCYPSAQMTLAMAEGQQGQNSIGMHNDCGLASTAAGVNNVYGKKVTSEQRETQCAYATDNCNLSSATELEDGMKDYRPCGGTTLSGIRRQFENNGLDAQEYDSDALPTMEEMGDHIKNGGTVSLAVNHSLLWHYEDAQKDGSAVSAILSGRSLQDALDMKRMKAGKGTFRADHAINLSNAVYNESGELTHFLVSDTGTGKSKMLACDYLQRALSGEGGITVKSGGCIFANRRKAG